MVTEFSIDLTLREAHRHGAGSLPLAITLAVRLSVKGRVLIPTNTGENRNGVTG